MDLTDPNMQLAMARGLMQTPGVQAPQSSYVAGIEERATASAAGLVNFGTNALIGAPMVASMAMGLMSPRLGQGSGLLAKGVRGADVSLSALDPFGAGFEALTRGMSGRMSLMGGGLAIAGAYGTSQVVSGATEFMRESMLEGQRDFLATRALARQLPASGFGAQSVLSAGARPFSDNQISTLNRGIQSAGAQFGMSAGQARNELAGMHQAGMIDTSNVHQISASFRQRLQELKRISEQVGGDIQEAKRVYQGLSSMGLHSAGARSSALGSLTTTSAMTGMGMGQVASTLSPLIQGAQQMGLGSLDALSLGTRSLQTAAVMRAGGALTSDQLRRYGGLGGYAQHMGMLHLGSIDSSGATAMMSHAFGAHGGINTQGLTKVLNGSKLSPNMARLRNLDPYAIEGMREEMSHMLPAAILSRVSNINTTHANNPLKARQEQFRFLQSMGINSAQEQRDYLAHLRAQPGADFAAATQSMRNDMMSSRSVGSLQQAGSLTKPIEDAMSEIKTSLRATFQRAGEAILRDYEASNRRISEALQGRTRSYGGGITDMGDMRAVARQIQFGGRSEGPSMRALMQMIDGSQNLQNAMSASLNVRGRDYITRDAMLTSSMDYLQYGAARGAGGLGEGLASVARMFGYGGMSEVKGSGLGGGLAAGFSRGGIDLGYAQNGARVRGSAADYFRLMGQDFGTDLVDRAGGLGAYQPNSQDVLYLDKMRGADFRAAYAQGLGRDLQRTMDGRSLTNNALGAGMTGAAGGFFYGASLGAFAGAGAGGIGAIPGALIGGGIGAIGGGLLATGMFTGADGLDVVGGMVGGIGGAALGTAFGGPFGTAGGAALGASLGGKYLGGVLNDAADGWGIILEQLGIGDGKAPTLFKSGLRGVLDEYSDSMGVAQAEVLTPEMRKRLAASYDQKAQSGALDPLARALFGQKGADGKIGGITYASLSRQQQGLLREMIRRNGGAVGEAFAGEKTKASRLSTLELQSVFAQEIGRNSAASIFDIGGTRARMSEVARLQGLEGGFDFGAIGNDALSDMERARFRNDTTRLGMDTPFGGAGSELAGLGDAYAELRSLAGTDDAIDLVSTMRGGRRVISEAAINSGMERLRGQNIADPARLGDVQKRLIDALKTARRGGVGSRHLVQGSTLDFSRGGKGEGLYAGMGGKGLLSAGMLENGALRSEMLGDASGVGIGISNLIDAMGGGKGMPQALKDAISKTGSQQFFSDKESVSSLGALLELDAAQAAGGKTLSGDELRKSALERLDQYEKDKVISPARAALLRSMGGNAFGSLREGTHAQLLTNLGAASTEELAAFQEGSKATSGAYASKSYSAYKAARNRQVRQTTERMMRRKSGDFVGVVGALGASQFRDMTGVRGLVDAIQGMDGDELLKLKEKGGDFESNPIAAARADLEERMKVKGISGSELAGLQQLKSQLDDYNQMVYGGDDYAALSSSALQGAFTKGKGGGYTLNSGRILQQMSGIVDPTQAAAFLDSTNIKTMTRFLEGGYGGQGEKARADRRRALDTIAGADSSDPQERSRQLLGHFGMLSEGMSDDDVTRRADRLVRDSADVKNNDELKEAFDQSIRKLFESFMGNNVDDSKAKKDNATDAVLKIKDMLGNAQILRPGTPIVHLDNFFQDLLPGGR